MFADFLPDSDWSNHSHRGWTTLVSFAVQGLAVGCLLLLPLLYNDGLPKLALLAPLLAPAPPPAAPPCHHARVRPRLRKAIMMGDRLMSPHADPTCSDHADGHRAATCPMIDPSALGVRHGLGDPHARRYCARFGIGTPTSCCLRLRPPSITLRLSRMMEGNLIHRVQPDYPALARQVRVQGLVVLRAMISRDGAIENLQVLSGHPLLVPAALDAVRQWRYRPYVLNGEPVEVETEVKVNFVLSGG